MNVAATTAPRAPAPYAPTKSRKGVIWQLGFALAWIYLAAVLARLPELLGVIAILHLPLIILLIATGVAFTNGGLSLALSSRSGVLLVLFTIWLAVCVPLSVYRGGSTDILMHVWADTALLALCLACLPETVQDCRRLMEALAVGTALIVLTYAFLGRDASRAQITTEATLSNPNLLAMQLELGLPFLAVPFARRKRLVSALCLFFMVCTLFISLSTGSRSGLLALGAVGLIIFLATSVARKLWYGIGAAAALAVIVLALPSQALLRYSTLFGSDADLSAVESSTARLQHLEESLRLTLANPIFGVGPGEFIVAAAADAKERNERAAWRETHNSYTEVSSESGLPGFFLYMALLLSWLIPALKLYRKTRRDPKHRDLNHLVFILLLAWAATLVNANFSSTAYQFYLPALGGISFALVRCGRAQLAAPVAARIPNPPVPARPPTRTDRRAAAPVAAGNPVRFGRMRRITGSRGNGGPRNTAG